MKRIPHQAIEASAGTGKTYTITGIVLRLLLDDEVEDLSKILIVTFTVAATEELKTRIRTALLHALAACEGRPFEGKQVSDEFMISLKIM